MTSVDISSSWILRSLSLRGNIHLPAPNCDLLALTTVELRLRAGSRSPAFPTIRDCFTILQCSPAITDLNVPCVASPGDESHSSFPVHWQIVSSYLKISASMLQDLTSVSISSTNLCPNFQVIKNKSTFFSHHPRLSRGHCRRLWYAITWCGIG